MTPESKPCACGRPGCLVVRRVVDDQGKLEKLYEFKKRQCAGPACASRVRVKHADGKQGGCGWRESNDAAKGTEKLMAALLAAYGPVMPWRARTFSDRGVP